MRAQTIVSGLAVGYAAVLSTLVATGVVGNQRAVSLHTLNVQRINVREPDGTLRLVISDKAQFPGLIVRGREIPHKDRRDVAGMLFFNDEGTENGGLTVNGSKTNGQVRSDSGLTFDQYEQDQVVMLSQSEADGRRRAGLTIFDRPDHAIDFARMARLETLPEATRREEEGRMAAAGEFGHSRAFVGKANGASMVTLRDATGRDRLRLKVSPAGEAAIEFLDGHGKVIRTVAAQS
ncbi:MAG TPA: hypothetical protein VH353_04970 [Caulobacteraceae bacterium]|jgi:hypothetical protein|nr:hypothetical protein [Caulobacteraceae bacterium]